MSKLHHLICGPLKSFFHPTQTGHWSENLSKLIHNLSLHYLDRLHLATMNLKDSTTHEKTFFSSQGMHKYFVELLVEPTAQLLFHRQSRSSLSRQTLRNLVTIYPPVLLPVLYEHLYPSLLSLNAVCFFF
jgi:hypothetical protein